MKISRQYTALAAGLVIAAGGMVAQAGEPSQASLMKQATVTKADAEKTALAKVPSGTVKSAELEQEHGALVWSFDIATPKSANIHEILVNAKTGAIVHAELESPSAQAKEHAAEQREQSGKH